MMVSNAIAKQGNLQNPSNLVGGAVVTNHHVYHIGTFAPSSSFSVQDPQPWLINQQDSHLSLHVQSTALPLPLPLYQQCIP